MSPTINSVPAGSDPTHQQHSQPLQDIAEQQQQSQPDWLTLQLSSQAAEHGFRLTWARSVIPIDRWFFLLLLLLVPISYLTEAGKSSSITAIAAAANEVCTAIALPLLGSYVYQYTARQAALWAGCLVAATRTAALLQLLLRPAWHVQRRTAVVFASWLLDAAVRLLLQLLHCGSGSSKLLSHACMAVTFVMYHMPFPVALPCCGGYWLASALLHRATAPGAAVSEYAVQLLLQLLLPLGTLYAVQRRARIAYLSVLGGQQQQEQQVHHSNSLGGVSISRSNTGGSSSPGAAPTAAAAAALSVHATSSTRTAPAAAEQAAAAHAQPADDAANAAPTASLVYESPLLHRTVAIKASGVSAHGVGDIQARICQVAYRQSFCANLLHVAAHAHGSCTPHTSVHAHVCVSSHSFLPAYILTHSARS